MRYMIYGGVILFICLPLILTTGPIGLAITFLVSWILGKILGADVSINDRISDVETKVREADRRAKGGYRPVKRRKTWTFGDILGYIIDKVICLSIAGVVIYAVFMVFAAILGGIFKR